MPKLPGAMKQVRTIVKDVRDAKKKLSPHQDPRSKMSASLRFAMDNPKTMQDNQQEQQAV